MWQILVTFLGLVALAVAQQYNYDDWHPPAPGDLRSPCPGMNALANHGFLPRNGRNITLAHLLHAAAAVNLSPESAIGFHAAGLRTSSDPASGAFTLRDLKKHNILEHDGSLSRGDAGTPGAHDQAFNPAVFAEFKRSFGNATHVSLALAAGARWNRVKSARRRNPAFSYGPTQRFNSYGETALYFQLLLDPATGTVPVRFLDPLFCEERLPYREGWRPVTSLNGLASSQVILRLAMATDEKDADLVLPHGKRGFSHGGELVL